MRRKLAYQWYHDGVAVNGATNAWITLTNLTLTEPVQIWVDTSVAASSPVYSKYFYRILPGR